MKWRSADSQSHTHTSTQQNLPTVCLTMTSSPHTCFRPSVLQSAPIHRGRFLVDFVSYPFSSSPLSFFLSLCLRHGVRQSSSLRLCDDMEVVLRRGDATTALSSHSEGLPSTHTTLHGQVTWQARLATLPLLIQSLSALCLLLPVLVCRMSTVSPFVASTPSIAFNHG